MNRLLLVLVGILIGLVFIERLMFPARAVPEEEPGVASERANDGVAPTAVHQEQPASVLSVAVLPFTLQSNGPDDDYFALGLTEELINALGLVPGLTVMARGSAYQLRGPDVSIAEMARQWQVAHVLQGSASRAGNQLSITARLTRMADGAELWSQAYDRRVGDTFAVRQDIVEKTATALGVRIDDAQRQAMRRAGFDDIKSMIAFQKGMELFERAHGDTVDIGLLKEANLRFEQVWEISPQFADAYLRHADLFLHMLISDARGKLDGNITRSDIEKSPGALRSDYDRGLQLSRDADSRSVVQAERALATGEWHGLSTLIDPALHSGSCRVPRHVELMSAPFGKAGMLEEAYSRLAMCDPFNAEAQVQRVQALLWKSAPGEARTLAEQSLDRRGALVPVRGLVLALVAQGDHEGAMNAAREHRQPDLQQFPTLSLVAAAAGDAGQADAYEQEFLGVSGPDDAISLALEAAKGNRHEANRLAALIDKRPLGYVALLEAVYVCLCGAPFELEYTPVFAGKLRGSGLRWPPMRPIRFPLKDW